MIVANLFIEEGLDGDVLVRQDQCLPLYASCGGLGRALLQHYYKIISNILKQYISFSPLSFTNPLSSMINHSNLSVNFWCSVVPQSNNNQFIMSREDLQRKVQSSSYPKEPNSPHSKRNEFYSADKVEIKLVRKKLQQKNLIEKVLQNITTSDKSEWKFISFQEKRSIAGFKARLEWLNARNDTRALFKFSFASCFFNQTGAIFEGDIIIEVQQLTFQTSTNDKRDLIDSIDHILLSQLQASKKRGFSQEMGRQNQYLRGTLLELGQLLRKMSESRKKIAVQKVDKKFMNYKQILYPAPATFSWNPLGNICITQNKFPNIKRPLIGEPSALKKYFQASRQQNAGSGAQGDADQVQLSLQKQGKMSVFNWHIQEQINLLIFKQENNKSEDYFIVKNRSSDIEAQMKKDEQKGGQDSTDLGSLSALPPKLRKAYERYFGGGERPGQLHRHDKLKVYDILSLSREDEDDIVYLIDRITTRLPGTSVAEIAFQNYLTAYPSILSGKLDRFRYQIISSQLRQIIAIPKLAFGAYLRAFVLQNEFLSKQLESYFREQYRMMRMQAHQQIYGLGSHSKFDSARAQLIFMDLVHRYLERNEQKETKISRIQGMKITRKTRLCRFNVEGVVGQQLKNTFLMGLFPLLIVKDRQMERFQFKKVKKIVSANARITAFIKKINEIVIKFEEGRTAFLKNIVQQYSKFKQTYEDNTMQPKRLFISYCGACRKKVQYLTLPSDEANECMKCKSRVFSQGVE